jgi:class 3 adenylate cyclase/pSer/pThr/pTyr-binding forkhead associated (FHA) protein
MLVKAILTITEPSGRVWEFGLEPDKTYTIGRAKENDIVLNDRRVSRKHAHIAASGDDYKLIDGYIENGQLVRSVNRIYVNGLPQFEQVLDQNDRITIGETDLEFRKVLPFTKEAVDKYIAEQPTNLASVHIDLSEINIGGAVAPPVNQPSAPPDIRPEPVNVPPIQPAPARHVPAVVPALEQESIPEPPPIAAPPISKPLVNEPVKYDDAPLGHTQLKITANEIIGGGTEPSIESPVASPEEIRILRRKAKMLELVYEMSRSLGTVFDLKEVFERATDLIFRGTPADRVIALLTDESDKTLNQIASRTRDKNIEKLTERLTVSRTITRKVIEERFAILSQDARSDAQFGGSESIVSQGVRSTICAPLITESNVHGVIYVDRLDPFSAFTEDHLELVTAVAAQAAVIVETVRAHDRLAREEVARANYGRFMPPYVVKQLLENPDSFRLGGTNQTITVLFADIRGFTALSERENPERVVRLLNRYFTAMSEIIFAHGGTLDKYIGDGLMALFGAPNATPDDAVNAVKAAVAMQRRINLLNGELVAEGLTPVTIGIGLHTGDALVGYIGSERRSEYTAIGDTVNLAARLESNARGGQILLSEATANAIGNAFPLVAQEPLTVRNRLQPVSLFELNIA